MLEALIKLGLSDKEAKVYLAALELAKDSVQNIAKKAKVNRPTTYVILDKLMKLGLVSTVEEGKKTYFIAESPKELDNILRHQQQEIEQKRSELDEVMNQLLALQNTKEGKPIVRYFEGADGLEAMDRYGLDKMKKNSEILYIIPIDIIEKQFPSRRKSAVGERVKMGIKSRAIYTHENGEIADYTNKEELREGIFLPREQFPIDGTISIYPWGLKLYSFDSVKPHGVIIESEGLAKNFTLFFNLAWKGAKES